MMDLAAAAAPLYIGAMVWEHRRLVARAAEIGPSAADYVREDTRASLAMGVGSLVVPITQYLGQHVVLGRGRYAKAMIASVATAVVVTTVADRVSAAASASTAGRGEGRRVGRRAAAVARVGGVAAIAGAGILVSASVGHLSSVKRQWERGRKRDLGRGVLAWTVALVGWDFVYYWNHRLQHEVRGMWAIHVVHHSSERYNLSTALRQPVASAFGLWVPYGAMARFGVRPRLIEYSRGLNLIYQFWIHTDTVGSLGRGEAVLNTPSHHRVHHGSNRRYLDRNHGGILIVWDRLFGTFQRELPEADPVVYGLTRNIGTHRLWSVMTHEYRDMFRDIANSKNWSDRLAFVVRTPGWAYRQRQLREDQVDGRPSGELIEPRRYSTIVANSAWHEAMS